MWVFLRQGSASQDLAALAPTIVAHGTYRAALCTDDREPDTLVHLGHVNDCVRLAVASGISEIDPIVLASTNPARYHRLDRLGSLGPGHQPMCSRSTSCVVVPRTRLAGRPFRCRRRIDLARGGSRGAGPALLRDTLNIGALPQAEQLVLDLPPGTQVRAVGVTSHSLTTRDTRVTLGSDDVSHAAVVERHRATGRIGLGFVTGFGLRRGAIASTVAHDAHNVVCVGTSGADMDAAVAPAGRAWWMGDGGARRRGRRRVRAAAWPG